jgi:hypothetical protein
MLGEPNKTLIFYSGEFKKTIILVFSNFLENWIIRKHTFPIEN